VAEKQDSIAIALIETLLSGSVSNSSGQPANLIDVVANMSVKVGHLGDAITPFLAAPGRDATGGAVGSLTEALMGMTAGLCRIAEAIGDLAEAVREHSLSDE